MNDLDDRKQELRRMLYELELWQLILVSLFIDLLRLRQWIKQIPVRWAMWQAGKR